MSFAFVKQQQVFYLDCQRYDKDKYTNYSSMDRSRDTAHTIELEISTRNTNFWHVNTQCKHYVHKYAQYVQDHRCIGNSLLAPVQIPMDQFQYSVLLKKSTARFEISIPFVQYGGCYLTFFNSSRAHNFSSLSRDLSSGLFKMSALLLFPWHCGKTVQWPVPN